MQLTRFSKGKLIDLLDFVVNEWRNSDFQRIFSFATKAEIDRENICDYMLEGGRR